MPRPIKDAVPEQTSNVAVPLPPDDKNWLNGRVRANDTTIGAEIRNCIQRVRDRESLAAEVFHLLYGDGAAGLIFLLGDAMRKAGCSRLRRALDQQGQARNMRPWWSDPDGYDAAVTAANRILEEFRPEGERTVDRADPQSIGEERYVIGRAAMVVEGGPHPFGDRSFTEIARTLLGPEMIAQSRWLKARRAEDAAIVAAQAQSGTSEPISPAIPQAVQTTVAADALPTSPPQISLAPPSVPAHPFFTAWLLSRAMLLGKNSAEPDETQIATQLAHDPTLRFIANLHYGPCTPESILEYRSWLVAQAGLGPPAAGGGDAASVPATPSARPRSSRRRKRGEASSSLQG
jgi:hypothetical protein